MSDLLPTPTPLPPTGIVDLDWRQPGRHELAERITRALAVLGARITTTHDAPPVDGPVDLVISERPEALAELDVLERNAGSDIAHRVGLIVLGQPAATADANLPLDFTDRELLLACRLVVEIVRLSRRSVDVERNSHELARLAAADPLTGLANRRAWEREAPARCCRARAAGQAICLAIFDVDRFKAVNDERGYATGDEALSAIARELAGRLRTGDLLARLGGDEFAALLVGSFDRAGALAIVDRVRAAVGQEVTARLGFELSLSAGCAVEAGADAARSEQAADLADLFAASDTALREAKRAGRNRAVGAGTSATELTTLKPGFLE
jgi:diguanylate cyclase (GGDEF)-like protein